MTESYIQYASGYQKYNISEADITKALADVREMDDEHAAFWVSVITDDENVIEVNKDMKISVMMEGREIKYQATNWTEVEELYKLLLSQKFEALMMKIK